MHIYIFLKMLQYLASIGISNTKYHVYIQLYTYTNIILKKVCAHKIIKYIRYYKNADQPDLLILDLRSAMTYIFKA